MQKGRSLLVIGVKSISTWEMRDSGRRLKSGDKTPPQNPGAPCHFRCVIGQHRKHQAAGLKLITLNHICLAEPPPSLIPPTQILFCSFLE